jgi:hypothetical protein
MRAFYPRLARRVTLEADEAMTGGAERHLEWDDCFNARDLGGLPTIDARQIRRGALVRADALDRLSPAGWASR